MCVGVGCVCGGVAVWRCGGVVRRGVVTLGVTLVWAWVRLCVRRDVCVHGYVCVGVGVAYWVVGGGCVMGV